MFLFNYITNSSIYNGAGWMIVIDKEEEEGLHQFLSILYVTKLLEEVDELASGDLRLSTFPEA